MGEIKAILILVGIPIAIATFIAFGIILATAIPGIQIILLPFWRSLTWAGKWFRRKTIESQLQGSVNNSAYNLNRSFGIDILPQCEIRWTNSDVAYAELIQGRAIVKLSLSKENQATNIYNATSAYVTHALLSEAKPFLEKSTSRAIDLTVIRSILKTAERRALTLFNNDFNIEEPSVRERFSQFEETEAEGYFSSLLLPELHFFGTELLEQTPSKTIRDECEEFVDWFYDLATRERGEQTNLVFEGKTIRVGVILVAASETYDLFGLRPYMRRAGLHAKRGCNAIYLLSRGHIRGRLLQRIADDLEKLGGFRQVAKTTEKQIYRGDEKICVTCVPLRPNAGSIATFAWGTLEQHRISGELLIGYVEDFTDSDVRVNVYGLECIIDLRDLSAAKLESTRNLFHRDQELQLQVVLIDSQNEIIRLSNAGTATDPKNLIDKLGGLPGIELSSTITGVALKDGIEVGLRFSAQIESGDCVSGFLPRSKATFSRYRLLTEIYPVQSTLKIEIHSFDHKHNSVIGSISNLVDPWANCRIVAGNRVHATIREVTEIYATLEVEDGLEGRLFFEETSWGNTSEQKENLAQFEVGSVIEVVVVSIDGGRRQMRLSVRALTKSPVELWFDENSGKMITAKVTSVSKYFAKLLFPAISKPLNLNISNFSWWYRESLFDCVVEGAEFKVVPIAYDYKSDTIDVGVKQLKQNDYRDLRDEYREGQVLEVVVENHSGNTVEVEIREAGKIGCGIIRACEVSNFFFIDFKTLRRIFKRGDKLYCSIISFNDRANLLELGRKAVLKQKIEEADYGRTYIVRTAYANGGVMGYSNDVEGKIFDRVSRPEMQLGESEVIIARKGNGSTPPELSLSD